MRRLLVLLIVVVGVAIAAQLQTAYSQSYPYDAILYVWHPTGDYDDDAILACGWHYSCDGQYPDYNGGIGLDWKWDNGSKTVWVRNRIYLVGGPTSSTWVARMQTVNTGGGCPSRCAHVYTTQWNLIGTIRNEHSQGASTQYSNLYGKSSGQDNATVVGTMNDPPDQCSSFVHTMQFYYSGPYDTSYVKNSALPGEGSCFHCDASYGITETYEYRVRYWAY